jgi:AbrB family looped-hinge helix DNA binding protein
MRVVEKLTTIVSTKGQVFLPKAIRKRRRWGAGARLIVEDTPDGVLLKSAPLFQATKPKDVFASLPSNATPKSLKEVDAGVAAEAHRQHVRR